MSDREFTPWPPALAERYRALGYWRGQTLGEFLRESAQKYGERAAIICGERSWSYAELDRRADRLAAGLYRKGLRPRDTVVVQLPNVAEFFAVCFALFRLGVTPVLALPAHRRSEIEFFLQATQAVAYIVADRHGGFDYRELARECRASVASLRELIVVGDAQELTPLDALYDDQPLESPCRQPTADEVALFQLSGGSTGTPKLIPRTHDDYLYSVRASADICRFDGETVYLAALPVAHNFPLSSPGTLGTFYAGGRVVLCPQADPETAFRLVETHAATVTALVPSLLMVWLAAAPHQSAKLRSLRLIQVGGARLNSVVAQRVGPVLGCRLQQVFGMAEGLVNYTRLDDASEVVLHTQGRPISPDDEIRVVDDVDRDVAPGEIGHLLTRGPYTIRSYYRADAHNARAFTGDGFYRTGDLVRQRPDGYLVVEGRSKDQINRGGEKIAVEEVENHLLAHALVRNVALVAEADAWLGERSCAFIELAEPPAQPLSRLALQIKTHLQARGLAAYKIPDRIEFIDRLPLTALGKVSKETLRAQLAGRSSTLPQHQD